MSDDRHELENGEPTAEQRLARDAVRSLSTPRADDAFRDALRERFVRGEAARGAVPRGASPRPRRRAVRWIVPLALAATVLIAVGIANRGSGWTVVGAGGEYVLVDGEPVPCDDLSPLQAALRPGCELVVPDGARVEVVSDVLALQADGGTDMTFPATPGRWFFRDVSSRVRGEGTLRVATGDGFAGASYRIDTGPAELLVTGTAFSVMSSEDYVCICVLEGGIAATLPDGSRREIPSGGRLTVSRDGEGIDVGAMHEHEREALQELKRRVAAE